MRKAASIGVVTLILGGYLSVAWLSAGSDSIHPKKEVAPRMDVYAPHPQCDRIVQEYFPNTHTDVTVSLDTYVYLKAKLRECGGDIKTE